MPCVRCVLKVPSLGLVRDVSVRFSDGGASELRRVLHKWIPASEEAREGATFTIQAAIPHRDRYHFRWIVLRRWQPGESINRAVEEAWIAWRQLPEEEPRGKPEGRVDLSDMTTDRIKEACPTLTDDEAILVQRELELRRRGKWSFDGSLDVNDRRHTVSHRIVVCSTLQLLGDARHVAPLARALADARDDDRLVWTAAIALAALPTFSATTILMEVLETGTPEQQAAAAWVLRRPPPEPGYFAPPDPIDPLSMCAKGTRPAFWSVLREAMFSGLQRAQGMLPSS